MGKWLEEKNPLILHYYKSTTLTQALLSLGQFSSNISSNESNFMK
jgi:hypothetical protein